MINKLSILLASIFALLLMTSGQAFSHEPKTDCIQSSDAMSDEEFEELYGAD